MKLIYIFKIQKYVWSNSSFSVQQFHITIHFPKIVLMMIIECRVEVSRNDVKWNEKWNYFWYSRIVFRSLTWLSIKSKISFGNWVTSDCMCVAMSINKDLIQWNLVSISLRHSTLIFIIWINAVTVELLLLSVT